MLSFTLETLNTIKIKENRVVPKRRCLRWTSRRNIHPYTDLDLPWIGHSFILSKNVLTLKVNKPLRQPIKAVCIMPVRYDFKLRWWVTSSSSEKDEVVEALIERGLIAWLQTWELHIVWWAILPCKISVNCKHLPSISFIYAKAFLSYSHEINQVLAILQGCLALQFQL